MKYYLIRINVKFYPEIFERIFRLIRYYGFNLYMLNFINVYKKNNINITFILQNIKNINLLINQLDKLIDINFIKFKKL